MPDDRKDPEQAPREPDDQPAPTVPSSPDADDTKQLERREFLRNLSTTTFAFVALGSFGGAPGGGGVIGGGAGPGAGGVAGGRVAKPGKPKPLCMDDDDEADNTDTDCIGHGVPTEEGEDRDSSCGDGEADESCSISSTEGGSGNDVDQNCGTATGGGNVDGDNACGDCDDDHDADGSCNQSVGGSTDSDEMCGHAHLPGGGIDEDQTCSATTADNGCGNHDTVYNEVNDPDQHCPDGVTPGTTQDSDQNCTGQVADATCAANPPAYASSPDEMCSSTEIDGACGNGGSAGYNPAYDEDASCGGAGLGEQSDQSCGSTVYTLEDEDENCSTADADEGCGGIPIIDPDNSGDPP